MRTIAAVFAVLCLLTAALSMQLAGVFSIVGHAPGENFQTQDLEGQAEDSAVNSSDGFSGGASASGDGDIIGLIISGGQTFSEIATFIVLFPLQLQQMGAPYWAAYPIGLLLQIVVSVGLIQAIIGRSWR
jgi:hypothetical protein